MPAPCVEESAGGEDVAVGGAEGGASRRELGGREEGGGREGGMEGEVREGEREEERERG